MSRPSLFRRLVLAVSACALALTVFTNTAAAGIPVLDNNGVQVQTTPAPARGQRIYSDVYGSFVLIEGGTGLWWYW